MLKSEANKGLFKSEKAKSVLPYINFSKLGWNNTKQFAKVIFGLSFCLFSSRSSICELYQ